MRLNSFLFIQILTSQGGKDSRGNSIGAIAEWSDPIPCHIKTNTDNRLGKYEDGIFHQATYNVLALPLTDFAIANEQVKRVRLIRRGVDLGEYDVMSIEAIETQNRLQITV